MKTNSDIDFRLITRDVLKILWEVENKMSLRHSTNSVKVKNL